MKTFSHTFTGFHFGVILFVLGAVVCGVYSGEHIVYLGEFKISMLFQLW